MNWLDSNLSRHTSLGSNGCKLVWKNARSKNSIYNVNNTMTKSLFIEYPINRRDGTDGLRLLSHQC
jgi:hypothetical protein